MNVNQFHCDLTWHLLGQVKHSSTIDRLCAAYRKDNKQPIVDHVVLKTFAKHHQLYYPMSPSPMKLKIFFSNGNLLNIIMDLKKVINLPSHTRFHPLFQNAIIEAIYLTSR